MKPRSFIAAAFLATSALYIFISYHLSGAAIFEANQVSLGLLGKAHPSYFRARRFAYAFLAAGVNVNDPISYLGYLSNVIASARALRSAGSTADIVLLVRLSAVVPEEASASATLSELPPVRKADLDRAGIKLYYIPRVKVDNFYTAVMDKFRILQLVQYERVLFLDTDVIPLCNLDYIFLSSAGGEVDGGIVPVTLRPNVVIAYKTEPANAGFFLLAPMPGDYNKIESLIIDRQEQGYDFDTVQGWGKVMDGPDDGWRTGPGKRGNGWDFFSAWSDQGLLYYWVKFWKRDVSMIIGDEIETYGPAQDSTGGTRKTETRKTVDVLPLTCPGIPQIADESWLTWFGQYPPYTHFIHFTGVKKPWRSMSPPASSTECLEPKEGVQHEFANALEFWFHQLCRAKVEWGVMGDIDVARLSEYTGKPPLGLYATNAHVLDVNLVKEGKRPVGGSKIGGR